MIIKRRFKGSVRIVELDSFIRDNLKIMKRRVVEADFTDLSKLEDTIRTLDAILRLDYFNDDIDVATLKKYVFQDISDLRKEISSCKKKIRELKKYIFNCYQNNCTNISVDAPPEIREMSEIVRLAVEDATMKMSGYRDRIRYLKEEKSVMTTLLQIIYSPYKFIHQI